MKHKTMGGKSTLIVPAMDNDIPIRERGAVPDHRGAWGHAASLHASRAVIHGHHHKNPITTKWCLVLPTFTFITFACLFLAPFPSHAATTTVNGVVWSYKLAGTTAIVTGANPAKGNLAIPSSLDEYPVTRIADDAFQDCSDLTSITIPDSVTYIEEQAFVGCTGLTNIHASMGNSVYTSKAGALFTKDEKTLYCYPAGKTGVYFIPDGVTNIGDCAFSSCSGLTGVTIPDSVTRIGGVAFANCSGLKNMTIPNSVTSIGPWAFYNCSGLKNLTIPDSVTSIANWAFVRCSGLTSMTIGNSVKGIGYEAFDDCSGLKTLYVPASWEGTSMLANASVPVGCTVIYSVLPEPVLALASSNRTFTADAASSIALGVTANVSWTARSSAPWLTVATANGAGAGTIMYSVTANTATNSRTGTITITGGGLTQTFTVTQSGLVANLELGANERSFTADEVSGMELAVTANVSWTAISSSTWLTVETASGSGNGNIKYALTANSETSSRVGTITVSGGG